MDGVFNYLSSLNPFLQGLIGSAVFAFSSWAIQAAFKRAKAGGSAFFRVYSTQDMVRHVLHKEYVCSKDMHKASYGASIALLLAVRWVLLGVIIAIFFIGVHSLLNSNWLFSAASWFCFNCFLEAYNWVKDTSDESHVSYIPDDVKAEAMAAMYPSEPNKAIQADAVPAPLNSNIMSHR